MKLAAKSLFVTSLKFNYQKVKTEMNPNPQNVNIEQAYQTLTIVWFALFVSQLLFLVVLFFARPEIYQFDFSRPLLGENAVMVIAFAALAVTNFLLSFILSKKYLNQAISEQNIGLVQTALVIGCALCESVTLFGLVLAFAFSYQYFFLWFLVGILGTILHFPKRDNLIAASYKK